ncbi:hypothetical protein JCM12141A_55300 [Mycolicibacterium hodleri]
MKPVVAQRDRVEKSGVGGDVPVGQEEVGVGAVEDDDCELLVAFGQLEERHQVGEHLRVDEVDRRIVEGDPPQRG